MQYSDGEFAGFFYKKSSRFMFDDTEASFYEKLLEDDCEKIDTTNVVVVDFKNKKVLSR